MKKLLHWRPLVVLLLLLSVLIYACRKDLAPQQAATDPLAPIDVQAVKAYYNQLKSQQGDVVADDPASGLPYAVNISPRGAQQQVMGTSKLVNRKYPLFSAAYSGQTADYSFVDSPLRYNRRTSAIPGYFEHAASQYRLTKQAFECQF